MYICAYSCTLVYKSLCMILCQRNSSYISITDIQIDTHQKIDAYVRQYVSTSVGNDDPNVEITVATRNTSSAAPHHQVQQPH